MLPLEHSAILLTFVKQPFVFKTSILSIFEWPLKTGFTVLFSESIILQNQLQDAMSKVLPGEEGEAYTK